MSATITIEVTEQVSGDVSVRIKQDQGYVTTREDRCTDAIAGSIKAHLLKELPTIVREVLAQKKT